MKKTLTVINNILCAVLLLATFASMCIPCWDFVAEEKFKMKVCRECGNEYILSEEETNLPEGYVCPGVDGAGCGATGAKNFKSANTKISKDDTASVMEYTWLAYNNKGLTQKMSDDGHVINDVIVTPFLLTICVIAGVAACLLNTKGCWQSIFPLVGGVAVTIEYLTNPLFQQGAWQLTLGLAIPLAIFGATLFAQFAVKVFKWFFVPVVK